MLMLITILVLLSNTSMNAQWNYVPNGSFEFHNEGKYPYGITQNSQLGYPYPPPPMYYPSNQLMKCINFCLGQEPFPYPPTDCFIFNGYYWPTFASPDYYHRKGVLANNDDPRVPSPHMYFSQYYDNLQPKSENPELDSAYIGVGMRLDTNIYMSNTFRTYKEYIQVKLEQPLLPSRKYSVHFFVSASVNNFYQYVNNHLFINQMCAFFSSDTIVVNRPYTAYPKDQSLWDKNLAYNSPPNMPIPYIHINERNPHTECAICSNYALNVIGDWQEISGILNVPEDSTYNYMTIGNFQSDLELLTDIKANNTSLRESLRGILPIYYYIDDLSVEVADTNTGSCECYDLKFPSLYSINITPNLDSLADSCCYDYHFYMPNDASLCKISMFEIVRNDTVFYTGEPDYGDFFPKGETITKSFCMDKFPTALSEFAIRYYTIIDGQEYFLEDCTDTVLINCECDCSDIQKDFVFGDRWEFKLVPVPDIPNACCWDLVLDAKYYEMSNMCILDLSNQYLLFQADGSSSLEHYNISSGTFIAYDNGVNKYWQAPPDFEVIPGSDPIVIGRICSDGIAPDQIRVNFFLSETINNDTCAQITPSLYLECKQPDSISCCDLIHLQVEQMPSISDLDIQLPPLVPPPDPYLYPYWSGCSYFYSLKIDHTPFPCFWNDTITISTNLTYPPIPFPLLSETKINLDAAYSGYSIPINYFRAFPGEMAILCFTFTTINDTCVICDTLICPPDIYYKTQTEEIETQSNLISSGSLKILPNPAEHSISVIFDSETEQSCDIILSNNLLQEVFHQIITANKGQNRINISTKDFADGVYFLTVKFKDKTLTQKVIIVK